MIELGGWGVVAVLGVGLLVVLRLIRMARRRLRRGLAGVAIAAVLTGYGGAGLASLDLGGFLGSAGEVAGSVTDQIDQIDQVGGSPGGSDRCSGIAGQKMSLGDAPAHVICAVEQRVGSAVSAVRDLPGLPAGPD